MWQEELVRSWFQAWLDKDGSAITWLFAEDAVYSECYGPEYHGAEQLQQWFADWNQRGTVLEWRIKGFLHDGNHLAVEWYFQCEYDQETGGFDGVSLIEFDENRRIKVLKEFQSKAEHCFPYEPNTNFTADC